MRCRIWLSIVMVTAAATMTIAAKGDDFKLNEIVEPVKKETTNKFNNEKLAVIDDDVSKFNPNPNIPMAENPVLNKMLPINLDDDFAPNPNIPMAEDPRFNKMLPVNAQDDDNVKPDHNITVADDKTSSPETITTIDYKPDPNIPMGEDPRFNKMLPNSKVDMKPMPYVRNTLPPILRVTEKVEVPTAIPDAYVELVTDDQVEIIDIDPGFSKFLPKEPATKIIPTPKSVDSKNGKPVKHVTTKNDVTDQGKDENEDYNYDENVDDYYTDDNEEEFSENSTSAIKTTESSIKSSKKPTEIKKPISTTTTIKPTKTTKPTTAKSDDSEMTDDEYYDEDIDEDDDDGTTSYGDDEEEEEEDEEIDDDADHNKPESVKISKVDKDLERFVSPSSVIKCPRDCICEKNMNNFVVATCSRLDLAVQKFDETVQDLQISDIDPKFPLYFSEEFFLKIGLKSVTTIKITNSVIQYVAPTAFAGLDNLFSLNLTNTGLKLLHPDTFITNLRMKLLSLSGNDLSDMQRKRSPNAAYMLKAPSVEELDLSNCNLQNMLPTALSQIKNAVYINLSNNKIKTLPETIFNNIPDIEEIDLSFNSIVTLPPRIFENTKLAILNLNHNDIAKSLDFIPQSVERLDLNYNKIRSVDSQLFKGLDNLIYLTMTANGIRKIHNAAFASLRKLTHIDLSFNDLDQISALTFGNNRNLDIIKLNDNAQLKQLPVDGFDNSEGSFNVYNFDISNCDISTIGENFFSKMPKLSILNMKSNNIESLPRGLFKNLGLLVQLDLSNNLLGKLNKDLFLNNRNLQKLDLSGNPIPSISTRLFRETTSLAELDVSDCDLTQLWQESEPKAKHPQVLAKLRYMNISMNDITTLYKSDLTVFNNLKIFDVTYNPLLCDDNFSSLLRWVDNKHVKLSDPLMGRKLATLDKEYYTQSEDGNWDELAKSICVNLDDAIQPYHHTSSTEKLKDSAEKIDSDDDDIVYNDDEDEDEEEDDDQYEEVDDNNNAMATERDQLPEGEKFDAKEDNDDGDDYYEEDDFESRDKSKPVYKSDSVLLMNDLEMMKEMGGKIITGGSDGVVSNHRIYRAHYIWPIVIVLVSMVTILLVIARIVSLVMRRRGERYRQALLDTKNSIIYQKLSEEISPPTPKVHRYMPIEQV